MGTYGKSRVNGPTTLSTQTLDTRTDRARKAASTGTKLRTSTKNEAEPEHPWFGFSFIREYAGTAFCDKNSAPIFRFLPGTLDAEVVEIRWGFGCAHFYVVYAGGPGALLEFGFEGRELLFTAAGQDFHSPINIVANPAGKTQRIGLALHKPAEAHSLHPASNHVAFCSQKLLTLDKALGAFGWVTPATNTRLRP